MNSLLQSGLRRALLVLLLIAAVVGSSYAATHIALQITLLVCMSIVAFSARSVRVLLILAASSVPLLGLIRRLSAGPDARVDFDPLILLPMVLVLAAILISVLRPNLAGSSDRSGRSRRMVWFGAIFSIFVCLSLVLNGAFNANVLYFAFALIVPVLLAVLIAIDSVPDVWRALERFLPAIGVAVGGYGIYQFFFLPQWDRNWMLTSGLESIGQPLPMAVRVFGASESPGPYAAFIGLVLIVCFVRGINSLGGTQVAWFVFCGLLTIPLLLSGVRSALLSVLVCAAVATVIRGRGLGRVLPVLFFVLVGVGIDRAVSIFGDSSTILTADRYTSFDPTQDNSFQARLSILDYISNPWSHLIGQPASPAVDNLPVDIMRAYGIVPFVLFGLFLIYLLYRGVRLLRRDSVSSVGYAVLYLILMGISGNLFLSSFGIIMAIAFGSALRLSHEAERQVAAEESLYDL